MKVYTIQTDARVVLSWDAFSSSAIHCWVPRKGWIRSIPFNKGKGRVLLDLTAVKTKNVERWVQDKASRLHTPKGGLCLVHCPKDDTTTLVALYHDNRVRQLEVFVGSPWPNEVHVPGTGKPYALPYDWKAHLNRWDAKALRQWVKQKPQREARERARARALKQYLKKNTLSTPEDFTKLVDNFVARGLLVIPPKAQPNAHRGAKG